MSGIEQGHVRSLYSASQSAMSDVLLTLYFAGACVASGAAGLVSPGELGSLFAGIRDGLVYIVFSWCMILVGIAGLAARLADSRMGEFYAIVGVSVLTTLNGVALLPEHPSTALRLAFAPAMMVPYAWMRLGFTVSRGEVASIKQAIAAVNGDRDGEGGDEH